MDRGYIVVDDVPFDKFFCFKAIVGAQSQFILTDKYVKKITITNWSKPCIILLNHDMMYERHLSESLLNWFTTNTIKVDLGSNRLY